MASHLTNQVPSCDETDCFGCSYVAKDTAQYQHMQKVISLFEQQHVIRYQFGGQFFVTETDFNEIGKTELKAKHCDDLVNHQFSTWPLAGDSENCLVARPLAYGNNQNLIHTEILLLDRLLNDVDLLQRNKRSFHMVFYSWLSSCLQY